MSPTGVGQPVSGGWKFLVAVDQAGGLQIFDIFPGDEGRLSVEVVQTIFLVSFEVAMRLEGKAVGDGLQQASLSGGQRH